MALYRYEVEQALRSEHLDYCQCVVVDPIAGRVADSAVLAGEIVMVHPVRYWDEGCLPTAVGFPQALACLDAAWKQAWKDGPAELGQLAVERQTVMELSERQLRVLVLWQPVPVSSVLVSVSVQAELWRLGESVWPVSSSQVLS